MAHDHDHVHLPRGADRRSLTIALGLIAGFMIVEVVGGALAHSLALLSDAAHMLTDAAALAIALVAARLAERPARGALTFGLGRAEILSAQANGITLLILALIIVLDAILRLISPPAVHAGVVLPVAAAGIVVSLLAARVLAPRSEQARSLNVEGSYRHILTDLYGFAATLIAAVVILATGFHRADPIASLLIAAVMLRTSYSLLKASGRIFMEAAPAGIDPQRIGQALAREPEVIEVHDLHVWEVTSGFPALSAHVVVRAGADCHERRRHLQRVLDEGFGIGHTTLQVDHEAAAQAPLQIELAPARAPARRQ